MVGQILDDIQGMIQGEVGIFLQLKPQLQEMNRSPVLTISDKANQLLIAQNKLESDLPDAITKSQSSSLSDLISASGFFILMEKQISDVNDLREEYTSLGESARPSLLSNIPNWVWYAAGGFVIWKLIRR